MHLGSFDMIWLYIARVTKMIGMVTLILYYCLINIPAMPWVNLVALHQQLCVTVHQQPCVTGKLLFRCFVNIQGLTRTHVRRTLHLLPWLRNLGSSSMLHNHHPKYFGFSEVTAVHRLLLPVHKGLDLRQGISPSTCALDIIGPCA